MTRLPSDLLIFAPSCSTMAVCSQTRTNGEPPVTRLGLGDLALVMREDEVAAAAVEVELGPRKRVLITEHSMCQPGRPGPHGLSQAGSPGACACHSTKSSGSRLCGSSGPIAALVGDVQHLGPRQMAEPAEVRPGIDAEVDAAARHVGEPALDQAPTASTISGMTSVARG